MTAAKLRSNEEGRLSQMGKESSLRLIEEEGEEGGTEDQGRRATM